MPTTSESEMNECGEAILTSRAALDLWVGVVLHDPPGCLVEDKLTTGWSLRSAQIHRAAISSEAAFLNHPRRVLRRRRADELLQDPYETALAHVVALLTSIVPVVRGARGFQRHELGP